MFNNLTFFKNLPGNLVQNSRNRRHVVSLRGVSSAAARHARPRRVSRQCVSAARRVTARGRRAALRPVKLRESIARPSGTPAMEAGSLCFSDVFSNFCIIFGKL